MEGESKGEAHGDGPAATEAINVPLRRWEDWERSRLRKLKREERRRREMERLQGTYTGANSDLLTPRTSTYDGSDTYSVTSSEDDHWGAQIGGYNEMNPAYPPPPLALMSQPNASAETIAASDLEAMLEVGFDDKSNRNSRRTTQEVRMSRFQLQDPGTAGGRIGGNGYTPLTRTTSPGPSPTTAVSSISSALGGEYRTHAKKRSGGRSGTREYGPLGPLDPGDGEKF